MHNEQLTSYSSLYHPELRKKLRAEEMSQSTFNLDYKMVHKSIPEPVVIRPDQIVYHEEEKTPVEVEFSVDDHSFREIIISQDCNDNPYATTNIQDILRNHHYSLNEDSPAGEPSIELPPLKLPDMNMQIDIMIERCKYSIEEEAHCRIYERDHPSLFAWDLLNITPTTTINCMNMQYVDVYSLVYRVICRLCQAKGLLAQFITFYITYIHTFNDEEDRMLAGECSCLGICWSSIPGYFILQRVFLNEFQKYHISRLSGGILRMNLNVDKVLSDSVANMLWYVYNVCIM